MTVIMVPNRARVEKTIGSIAEKTYTVSSKLLLIHRDSGKKKKGAGRLRREYVRAIKESPQ